MLLPKIIWLYQKTNPKGATGCPNSSLYDLNSSCELDFEL